MRHVFNESFLFVSCDGFIFSHHIFPWLWVDASPHTAPYRSGMLIASLYTDQCQLRFLVNFDGGNICCIMRHFSVLFLFVRPKNNLDLTSIQQPEHIHRGSTTVQWCEILATTLHALREPLLHHTWLFRECGMSWTARLWRWAASKTLRCRTPLRCQRL